MKLIISFLFLLQSVFAFSQKKEITKILNQELTKEIRYQKENPDDYSGEKFDVVENFKIDNGILRISVKKKNLYKDGFYTEKQEVYLQKITTIAKDMNIIFETQPDAVTVTNTEETGEKSSRKTDMFFLHLSVVKQNEYLANELVKAFKKAGYKIEKGNWYD